MSYFNSPPAFGYETKTLNALESHFQVVIYNNGIQNYNIEKQNKNSFYTSRPIILSEEDIESEAYGRSDMANKAKLIALLPPMNLLVGIHRINMALKTPEEILSNKFNHIVRGSLEILGLGIFFLPIDILVTFYRSLTVKID